MTDAEKKTENDKLVKRLTDYQEAMDEAIRTLQTKAYRAFLGIEVMSWGVFLTGVSLVAVSIIFYVITREAIQTLGLTGLGLADLVGLFFYGPMNKIQVANANFSQQVMILNSWASTNYLQLLAMNVNNPDSVEKAAKNIQSETLKSVSEIYKFIEEKKSASSKGGTPAPKTPSPGSSQQG